MREACADLNLTQASGQLAEDLAQQLSAPALLAADGEFVPTSERHSPDPDAEIARAEYENALIVYSLGRRVAHRALAATLEQEEGQAATACGWKFGSSPDITFPSSSELPSGHKTLCARCFPRWRAFRKLESTRLHGGQASPPKEVGEGAS